MDLKNRIQLDATDYLRKIDAVEKRTASLQRALERPATMRVNTGNAARSLDAVDRRLERMKKATTLTVKLRVQDEVQLPRTPRAPKLPAGGTVPPLVPPLQAPADEAAALARRIKELGNAVNMARNDFIAMGNASDVTDEQVQDVVQTMTRLQREIGELRPIAARTFGAASNEARALSTSAAQAQRTVAGVRGEMSRLGLASQVKLGIEAAGGLNVAQQANGIRSLALMTDTARISQGIYNKTLEKFALDAKAGEEAVVRLASRLKISEETAREGIRQLVKKGYELSEAERALSLAAASAVQARKTASEGIEGYTDAIAQELSARLNSIGVSENLSTFYQREARALGVTVEQLDRAAKKRAELALMESASADELEVLADAYSGVAGANADLNLEIERAQRNLGGTFGPTVMNVVGQLNNFLEAVNAAPAPLKNAAASAALFGVAAVGIGLPIFRAYRAFKDVAEGAGAVKKALKGLGTAKVAGEAAELATNLGRTGSAGKAAADALTAAGAAAAGGGVWARTKTFVGGLADSIKNLAGWAGRALGPLGQLLRNAPKLAGGTVALGVGAALGGWGIGRKLGSMKDTNGRTLDENVQNATLRTFHGYSREQVADLRAQEDALKAYNEEMTRTAALRETISKIKDERYVQAVRLDLRYTSELREAEAALAAQRQLGTPAQVAAAEQRVRNLQQTVKYTGEAMRAEKARYDAAQKQAEQDKQDEGKLKALREQRADLAKQQEDIRIGVRAGDFAQDFAQIAQQFREQRAALERQIANDKNITVRIEARRTLAALDRTQQRVEADALRRQLESDKKAVADNARAIEQARIDVMKEGAEKRRAEAAAETRQVQAEYAAQLAAARSNRDTAPAGSEAREKLADVVRQLEGQQGQAVAGIQARLTRDLGELAAEAAKKNAELVAQAEQAAAQLAVTLARGVSDVAAQRVQAVEGQRGREMEQAEGSARARLAIEERLSGTLLTLRVGAAQAAAQAERAQAQATYAQAMRDAQQLEAGRAAAQQAARAELQNALALGEMRRVEAVRVAEAQQVQDMRRARREAYAEALETEMQGLEKMQGAELASLRLRLAARREASRIAGDAGGVDALDEALKRVEQLNLSRVEALRDTLREAARSAGDVANKTREAVQGQAASRGNVGAQRAQARSAAASPFNDLLTQAREQQAAIQKSLTSVISLTPEQRASAVASYASLNNSIAQLNAARNRAIVQADAEFARQQVRDAREKQEALGQVARSENAARQQAATTDAQLNRLRRDAVGLAQVQAQQAARYVVALRARGATELEVAQAVVDALDAQNEVRAAAQAVVQGELDVAEQVLDVHEARLRADLQVQGLGEDAVAVARVELDVARDRLALAERQAAAAQDEAAARVAAAAVQGARGAVAQAGSQLQDAQAAQYLRRLEQGQQLLEARVRTEMLARGVQEDAAVQAAVTARMAQRGVELARERLAVARTQEARDEAAVALGVAEQDARVAALEATRAQEAAQASYVQQVAAGVEQVRQDLAARREALEAARQLGREVADSYGALGVAGLGGAGVGRAVAVAAAELERSRAALRRSTAEDGEAARGFVRRMQDAQAAEQRMQRAAGALAAFEGRAEARAGEWVAQTRAEAWAVARDLGAGLGDPVAFLRAEMARLRTVANIPREEAERAKASIDRLTASLGAQQAALSGLAQAYRAQADAARGIQDITVDLGRELDEKSTAGLSLLLRRRLQAADELRDALKGDDLQRIREAGQAYTEAFRAARQERERLGGLGLDTNGADVRAAEDRDARALLDGLKARGPELERLQAASLSAARQLDVQAQAAHERALEIEREARGVVESLGDALSRSVPQVQEVRVAVPVDAFAVGGRIVDAAIRDAFRVGVDALSAEWRRVQDGSGGPATGAPAGAAGAAGAGSGPGVRNISQVFNVHVDAGERSPAQLWDALEDEARRRGEALGGGC